MGFVVIGVHARGESIALAEQSRVDVVIDARQGKQRLIKDVKKVTNEKEVDATVNITRMRADMIQTAQVCSPFVPSPAAPYSLRPSKYLTYPCLSSSSSSKPSAQHMLDIVAEHNIAVEENPIL